MSAPCAALPSPPSPPAGRAYTPRDPSESVLVQVVREHLPALVERIADAADADSQGPVPRLPRFVLRELRALLRCGDFSKGFARSRCDSCRADRILPFS